MKTMFSTPARGLAVALFCLSLAVQGCHVSDPPAPPPAAPVKPIWLPRSPGAKETAATRVFKKASPSVVAIRTSVVRRSVFDLEPMKVPLGAGSGFVWDKQGHIVTNFHVVHQADAIEVTLADGSTHDARTIGSDPTHDLAIIKIDGSEKHLVPLQVGKSSELQIGQRVFAIGHPFGFSDTLTTGVVSGLRRQIESPNRRRISNAIQTDAAINPGSSGGPLLDDQGRLIGVNTAIYSPSGTYVGIGFAIPVDTVRQVVPRLISNAM